MALLQYVTRRGERLWYRRAFPKELWPVVGKAPFALSLQTADPKEAHRARPEAERRYHAKVDAARAELARKAEPRPPFTKRAAEALAVQWFLRSLETAEDFRTAAPTPDAVAKAVDDAEWAETEARRALAEGELWDERRLARCLRDEAGYSSEPLANAHLTRLLGRAAVAAFEVEQCRARGRYGGRPKDPLFAAAMEAPKEPPEALAPAQQTPGHTIADLEAAYRKAKFGRLSPATRQGYVPVFRLLREMLGAETPLASLAHEEGQQLFDAAMATPVNAQKLPELRGRSLQEQIAEGKRLGLPTLAPKSVNDRYMANLGALFRFAQSRGWMDRNPVQGLRTKKAAAGEARAFGLRRLKILFGVPPWTPPDRTGGGKPIRYFGPLLALFHGLRLGEVAGLQIRDIGEERGQPMLFIRSGARQLKTEASTRDLPVHPELLRLGFLEYAKARRKSAAPEAMLFEGEKAFARDQWGRPLGEWFAKRVTALGIGGNKRTFHALRHDHKAALREAEIGGELADYLMGHSHPGMGARYGGRQSLVKLQGAVRKVQFEGLKLPS